VIKEGTRKVEEEGEEEGRGRVVERA